MGEVTAAGAGERSTTSTLLNDQAPGTRVRITDIDGDRHTLRRFLALGLRVGTDLTVSQMRGDSVVVICGSTRVALGPEMAQHLRIEAVG